MTETTESAPAPTTNPSSPLPLFVFAAIVTLGLALILTGGYLALVGFGGADDAFSSLSELFEEGEPDGPFTTAQTDGKIPAKMRELMEDLKYRLDEAYGKSEILGHKAIVQRMPETRALVDDPRVLKLTISYDSPDDGIGVLWRRAPVVRMNAVETARQTRRYGAVTVRDGSYLGQDGERHPLRIFTLEQEIKKTGVRIKILAHTHEG